MTLSHWEKSSVFDSIRSNDSSQTSCIMEELLKIEKNEKIPFSYAQSSENKEQKAGKKTFNEF